MRLRGVTIEDTFAEAFITARNPKWAREAALKMTRFATSVIGCKVIGGRRFWRIPVMEGEFLVQDTLGLQKGIGGGNFFDSRECRRRGAGRARRRSHAACRDGVIAISAGNDGGKLGPHHFHLRQIMAGDQAR